MLKWFLARRQITRDSERNRKNEICVEEHLINSYQFSRTLYEQLKYMDAKSKDSRDYTRLEMSISEAKIRYC
jgi:hypothetical protein